MSLLHQACSLMVLVVVPILINPRMAELYALPMIFVALGWWVMLISWASAYIGARETQLHPEPAPGASPNTSSWPQRVCTATSSASSSVPGGATNCTPELDTLFILGCCIMGIITVLTAVAFSVIWTTGVLVHGLMALTAAREYVRAPSNAAALLVAAINAVSTAAAFWPAAIFGPLAFHAIVFASAYLGALTGWRYTLGPAAPQLAAAPAPQVAPALQAAGGDLVAGELEYGGLGAPAPQTFWPPDLHVGSISPSAPPPLRSSARSRWHPWPTQP